MTHFGMRARVLVTVLAAAGLLLSCGTTEEPATASASGSASEASESEPITLTDSRGEEVTLPGPAEDVVALEWSETEDLVALGVMPVGVADVEGYAAWVGAAAPLDESVTDVGTRQEPSVDSIVSLEPDLVIMEGGRGNALVGKLEEHIPVLVIEGSDASSNLEQMRENFELIAQAVGKEDKAATVLEEFDTALAEGKQRLADAGAAGDGFAMADGWMEGSSVAIRMFGQGSLMSDLAEELGLENKWTGKVDEVWGLGQTDVEGLTNLPNLHFFYSASEEDVFADQLAGNPIWERLPFVEQGQVYRLDPGTWTFGGPRSAEYFIDQVVSTLTS